MKRKLIHLLASVCLLSSSLPVRAVEFESGSTGADGPLIVEEDTYLQVPPDGIFNFTIIEIRDRKTLRFLRNELNTPVYLLSVSNVTIAGTILVAGLDGTIRQAGAGGPGGFDGGNPPSGGEPPGDGYGPGGGRANFDTAATPTTMRTNGPAGNYAGNSEWVSATNRYGNTFLQPLIGGSGGGGAVFSPNLGGDQRGGGGGGGGGALLIAAPGITMAGQILAYGGVDTIGYHGGSGGAVRLVGGRVAGNGSINATGNAGGGDGRVRIDTLDRNGLNINVTGARYSIGRQMAIFPSPTPRLDFIEVAGKPVTLDAQGSVLLTLDVNSSTNQTAKILARNFSGLVPLELAVIPESGPSSRYQLTLDMGATNQAVATFNIQVPVGVASKIHAWTR